MNTSVKDILEQLQANLSTDDAEKHIKEYGEVFNNILTKGILNKLKTGKFDFIDPDTVLNKIRPEQLLDHGVELNPSVLIEKQIDFMQSQMKLWQQTATSLMGQSDNGELEDIIKPERGDNRFAAEEWNSNPLFKHIKQSYLLNSQFINSLSEGMSFKDDESERKVKFYLRQLSNSLSPTNFAALNPDVHKEIISTKGENLKKGLKNFLNDLENSPEDALSISMVTEDAFVVGEDIATTPGKVVFQNKFLQLIQYEPTTTDVYKTPILLSPAFINKYYILDLAPKNSYVKWLVNQGFTVFIISWVNPDDSMGDAQFEDYMIKGILAAKQAVTEITGEDEINAIGYCVGGTVLACAQAYLTSTKQTPFKSTSFLVSLLDFSKPGEVGVYITDEFIDAIDKQKSERKIFDGRKIGVGFSLLRENNLYWSYFINNYLMGKDPAAFDLLFWNSDASNMPLSACSYYLKNMYRDNKLIESGGLVMNGESIDIGCVEAPSYFLSTISDHIAIWEGTYLGAQKFGGSPRFVLSGSGHIAGVINPPEANKYGYWLNDDISQSAEQWLEGSSGHEGSWWLNWLEWITPQAGEKIAARVVGENPEYPAIENAPGSYVRVRCSDIL